MTKSLDELKQKVSLEMYVEGQGYSLSMVRGNGHRLYRSVVGACPICGHKDHLFVYPNTNSFYSYSQCVKGGSIIDWFIQVEGLTLTAAIQKLYLLAGEEPPMKKSDIMIDEESPHESQDLTEYVLRVHENTLKDPVLADALRTFCAARRLDARQVFEHKLGIVHWTNKKTGAQYKRLILPVWKGSSVIWYTRRAIDAPETEKRFMDVPGVSKSEAILNVDYLDESHAEPIFLTESIVDAFNLESLGYKAIAINSTGNLEKFMKRFKSSRARNTILIGAFDSDEAGKACAAKLHTFGYTSLKKPRIKTKRNKQGLIEDVTDINDWYIDSLENAQNAPGDDLYSLGIKVSIDKQIALRGRSDNVECYLDFDMLNDLEKISAYQDKKIGFPKLDEKMNGLQVGLYVVGGVSSVGKTTFVHQLADQLAQKGNHVLYFSLEQSKLEMVTKSLARTSAKLDLKHAISSIAIRKGAKGQQLQKSIEHYKTYASNLSIIEGNFETNVMTIQAYIKQYIEQNHVRPIIVIDYLQIIPPIEKGMSDKAAVDVNVRELKRLSHKEGVPIFVISSFNRANYLAPVSFEAFKESGGIEYTADVVWGLQLGVINSEDFLKLDKQAEKIVMVNKAKAEEIRDIELVCLKNRNGSLFTHKFSYYAKYDYYQENEGLGDFTAAPRNDKGERVRFKI
ncbi:MAG: bifunctional DNA primase/helicase [Caryophanon sp.]|nr:bifunctional DNA primase/helicase [Caryophanon sp.]